MFRFRVKFRVRLRLRVRDGVRDLGFLFQGCNNLGFEGLKIRFILPRPSCEP